MSCKYCRGEQSLLDNTGEDGGWHAEIRPHDGTITARFSAGALYDDACGELELDIEYCPKCGADMAGMMADFLEETE